MSPLPAKLARREEWECPVSVQPVPSNWDQWSGTSGWGNATCLQLNIIHCLSPCCRHVCKKVQKKRGQKSVILPKSILHPNPITKTSGRVRSMKRKAVQQKYAWQCGHKQKHSTRLSCLHGINVTGTTKTRCGDREEGG